VYECFAIQICAFKLEAECQAEEHTQKEAQEKVKSAKANVVLEEEDANANSDGEVEHVVLPKHAKGKCIGGRTVISLHFVAFTLDANALFRKLVI
jgi:hypothetical protein